MLSLIEHAFGGVNAFYSVLLIGAMLYWLGMIAGIFHLDHDAADHGGEAHDADNSEADLHSDSEMPVWQEVLSFFLPGKVPVTVALSLLAIAWWTASMSLTWLLNPGGILWLDLVLQIPVLALGLFVLKYAGRPVGLFMGYLQADVEPRLPGKVGRVVLSVGQGRAGQIEIIADGSPLLLSAITDQEEVLAPGTQVLVLGSYDGDTLLVRPFVLEEN